MLTKLMKRLPKLPNFFIWSIIFAFAFYITTVIFKWVSAHNPIIQIFLSGLTIEIISKIAQSIRYAKLFLVDRWFIFWSIIHSASFFLINSLLSNSGIQNQIAYFALGGLGFAIISQIVKIIPLNNKSLVIISVCLILLVVLINAKGNIPNFGSLFPNSCPQINVPMKNGFIAAKNYNGWQMAPYDSNTQVLGINFGLIYCFKGNMEGRNPNYSYCGGTDGDYIAYIEKTEMNADGTIGKTTRKTFVNIYDEYGLFLKTICGEDPDVVAERQFKGLMNQFEDLFSW